MRNIVETLKNVLKLKRRVMRSIKQAIDWLPQPLGIKYKKKQIAFS